MCQFNYRRRAYVHFDLPLRRETAERLATNPVAVAEHQFFPFIFSNVITQKIGRTSDGRVVRNKPKKRTIAYPAHSDSHIFSHYSDKLQHLHEAVLDERVLETIVTAFRQTNGRSNVHFANEVFEFIRAQPSCAALAMDVSDFFGSLDHELLKRAWASLLMVDRLPEDHFAVFRAITKYCQVEKEALYDALHIPLNNPRLAGKHRLRLRDREGRPTIEDNLNRLCPAFRFRQWVRERGLLQINLTGRGIPQGSPISAVLSNIYMVEMDAAVNSFVTSNGGLYRRYCDDILVVMPTAELRDQARHLIETWMKDLRLRWNPAKTEAIDFGLERPIPGKPLQYLGFTFDGVNKRIRPGSVARFYRKMRRGVLRAKLHRRNADDEARRTIPSPLKKKLIYRRYSYLGRKLGKNREEKRNFLSYAFGAAQIMNDPGIKRQVKAHWKRLKQEIEKPLR